MSTNGTGTGTCQPAELAGAIEAYARSLRTIYVYLLVATVLGSLLLPFFIALFYFSRSGQWRTPMFIFVVLSALCALMQSLNHIVMEFQVLYNPLLAALVVTQMRMALTALLELLPSYFVDYALLCRMLAVYPPALTSRPKFYALFGPAMALKLLRVASIIMILVSIRRHPADIVTFKWNPELRIWGGVDRLITAVDNAYATAFFLRKIEPAVRTTSDPVRFTVEETGSFGTRLRALFWFSVTNFVLPAPLYVIQIVLALSGTSATAYAFMMFFANFASVICVAFATIWCSSTFRTLSRANGVSVISGGARVTSLRFAPGPNASVDDSDGTSDRRTRVSDDRGEETSQRADPLKPDYPMKVSAEWMQGTANP